MENKLGIYESSGISNFGFHFGKAITNCPKFKFEDPIANNQSDSLEIILSYNTYETQFAIEGPIKVVGLTSIDVTLLLLMSYSRFLYSKMT